MKKQAEEVNFAVPLVLEVETSDSGASQQHSSTLWNDISLQVRYYPCFILMFNSEEEVTGFEFSTLTERPYLLPDYYTKQFLHGGLLESLLPVVGKQCGFNSSDDTNF